MSKNGVLKIFITLFKCDKMIVTWNFHRSFHCTSVKKKVILANISVELCTKECVIKEYTTLHICHKKKKS